jgi:hypothetical protein
MNNGSQSSTQLLALGYFKHIKGARNQTIYCQAGCLLISQYGDIKDYVLWPGEQMLIHTDRLVLVEACRENSAFQLVNGSLEPVKQAPRVIDRLTWQLSRPLRLNL